MSELEVVVIGGGPAGASAARLLALWGHRMTLLTRPSPLGGLAESIPPSCRKLFDRIGATEAIERGGFVHTTGNTVWWGEQERVVTFPDNTHGWQVARDRFDALLLQLASDAGVQVRVPTTSEIPKARWTLDCSGRAGVIARHGYRKAESGQRTLALTATWECAVDDDAHTLVESYENGWAWSVPFSRTQRCVALMVDPALTRINGLSETYHAELAKTSRFRELTQNAKLAGDPWACDASGYGAHRMSDDGVLLVGDAASFVDPLSSFGIKKALASAWLAAVVTHTCLIEPALQTAALEFYDARERSMYDSLQRQSAEFSVMAADRHAHDFWLERATIEAQTPESTAEVLAAFEDLKQRPSISLQPGRAVRREELPVVRGNRIGLATHLVSPSFPQGIRYVREVDLVKLADYAGEYRQVPDLYEAYNRAAPPVPLHDFLAALSLTIAGGLLEHV